MLESIHVESRDDPKVIRAALHPSEEIRITCGVGVDNLGTRENDLKVDDIINSPSIATAVTRNAA